MPVADLLKRSLPPVLYGPARDVYHALYRPWLRMQWRIADWNHPPRPDLPPAKLRFKVGEDLRPEVFVETGRRTAENLAAVLERSGEPLRAGASVLDFGCGCGRTLLWLTREHPSVAWHGSDVDTDAVGWARVAMPQVAFAVNGPLPPLPFSDASFDMVFGVSVFTHLSEEYQRAWVPELRRVLKPGGLLVLSVYGRTAWSGLKEARQIEDGAFVFHESGKLKGIQPDWYHTAFQNRARLEAMVTESFARIEYQEGAFGLHDAVVARRT